MQHTREFLITARVLGARKFTSVGRYCSLPSSVLLSFPSSVPPFLSSSFPFSVVPWSWCLCWSLAIVTQKSQDVLSPQLLPACWEKLCSAPLIPRWERFLCEWIWGFELCNGDSPVRGRLGFEPRSHHHIHRAHLQLGQCCHGRECLCEPPRAMIREDSGANA